MAVYLTRRDLMLLGIAALGIFGLAAFNVSTRTKQIGTRRAIGARRLDIVRYFLIENWLITTVGVLVGCVLALLLGFWLSTTFELPRLKLYYLVGGRCRTLGRRPRRGAGAGAACGAGVACRGNPHGIGIGTNKRNGMQGRTILVIDDNEAVRTALDVLLTLEGARVETVATPQAGIERVARGGVDLVLQDMNFRREATSGAEGIELFHAHARHGAASCP